MPVLQATGSRRQPLPMQPRLPPPRISKKILPPQPARLAGGTPLPQPARVANETLLSQQARVAKTILGRHLEWLGTIQRRRLAQEESRQA
jgi:hypothetical protein